MHGLTKSIIRLAIQLCALIDRNEELTMASGVATTRLQELHFINWLN